jgi:hypothetical protein
VVEIKLWLLGEAKEELLGEVKEVGVEGDAHFLLSLLVILLLEL